MTPSPNWRPCRGGWTGVFRGTTCRVAPAALSPGVYMLFIGSETTPRRYGYLPSDADMEGEIERYRRREEIRARRQP